MVKAIDVVFSEGVLKPTQPIDWLKEDAVVRVVVNDDPVLPVTHPLADVVGTLPDEDAAEMMRVIDEEFGKVDPNDWK